MKRSLSQITLFIFIVFTSLGCVPGQENKGNPQTADYWEKAALHREEAAQSYEQAGKNYRLEAEKGRTQGAQFEESSDFIDQDAYTPQQMETSEKRAGFYRQAAQQENSAGSNLINAGKSWDTAAKNWVLAAREYGKIGNQAKEQAALDNAAYAKHHANKTFLQAAESFSRAANDSAEKQGNMLIQKLRAHEKAAENYEAIASRGLIQEEAE